MENNEITIRGIEFVNFDNVKKQLKGILESCELEQVTVDNVGEAKKTRATLNKMKKAISTQRIAYKNEIMKPYNELEAKCKELDSDIDCYSSLIDEGVKKVEEDFRQARKEYIISLYNDEKLKVDLGWFIQDNWLLQSTSDKKVEKEVREYAKSINECIATLKSMNHEFEFEILEFFNKTISFEKAIAEGNRLINSKKRKEEILQREKDQTKIYESEMRAVGSLEEDESITEDGEIEKVKEFHVKVKATESVMDDLITFMTANNINFEFV